MVWDAEEAFGYDGRDVTYRMSEKLYNSTGENSELPRLFRALVSSDPAVSDRFKAVFSSRVALHMFNDGALTDENIQARYDELAAQMGPVIPDFDDLPQSWLPNLNDDYSIGTTWIPGRRAMFLEELTEEGLYTP